MIRPVPWNAEAESFLLNHFSKEEIEIVKNNVLNGKAELWEFPNKTFVTTTVENVCGIKFSEKENILYSNFWITYFAGSNLDKVMRFFYELAKANKCRAILYKTKKPGMVRLTKKLFDCQVLEKKDIEYLMMKVC